MSNFKLIFMVVFVGAAVFGVLVFSGIINLGTSSTATEVSGTATVWGTFPNSALTNFLSDFNLRNQKIHVSYIQKDPATFDQALIEALASGNAPDLVLLPDNLVWRYQDKMTHIPFTSLPAQTFQSTFVQSANIYAMSDGFVAVPWATDPLVMFYNRDLLQGAGMAQPPVTWQAFTDSIPLLAKKESDLSLIQRATALGTYSNIAHAKDILAMLFFESANPFITSGPTSPIAHFGATAGNGESANSVQAVNFYMAFSDPLKQVYTWNAGESLDRDLFTQSNLAYYFGVASELPAMRAKNPNLNFGVALPPQAPGVPVTSGHVYGFAIPKTAPNQLLSFTAATLLSSADSETALVAKSGTDIALIPARRDVLAQKPTADPYLALLYNAALVQRSWLDPNPTGSNQIFNTLIKDISSSNLPTDAALSKAAAQLGVISAKI